MNGPLKSIHITGVQLRHVSSQESHAESVWIYGRGGALQAMTIEKLYRCIQDEDCVMFCRELLRNNNIYYDLRNVDSTKIFRGESKYRPVPIRINLEALQVKFSRILHYGYDWWLKYSYDSDFSDAGFVLDEYDRSIDGLAASMALTVREQLRTSWMMTDFNEFVETKSYPHLLYEELPAGVCFLIEQFGLAESSDTHMLPRLLHRWDGSELVEDNSLLVYDLLRQIKDAGVKFRRVNMDRHKSRTLWDSIAVKADLNGHFFDAYTTFSSSNYNLPRDAYLAILLCGESSMEPKRSVEFYAPRLARYNRQRVLDDVKKHEPGEATALERNAMPASNQCPRGHLRVNGSMEGMHITGVQSDGDSQESIWIYGRGGAGSAMMLNSVARGVTEHECSGFCKALLRHGP